MIDGTGVAVLAAGAPESRKQGEGQAEDAGRLRNEYELDYRFGGSCSTLNSRIYDMV